MSFILNMIKEKVQNSIKVDVLASKYGKYPVVVTDTTDSITAGWALTYFPQKSKFAQKLHEPRGRFSEITITNADALISDLSVVFGKFVSGDGVSEMYGTNTAMYQPNDKMWYTAMQKTKGVSITLTVTDENSPFHMLQASFFVMQSGDANRHPIYGFDYCFNAEANTWTDKRDNASMTAKKKQMIPLVQEEQNGPKLAKVSGNLTPNGMVAIDEANTKIEYVQEATNERKLVSALYESVILELALEQAVQNLPASTNYNGAFGSNENAGQNWNTSTPAQNNGVGANQQPNQQQQAFGQNTANNFGTTNQNQSQAFGNQQTQSNTFGSSNQNFGQQPSSNTTQVETGHPNF